VADDAGALLVRSGLVSSNALEDARARVASIGGTLGEQLVSTGVLSDDALTDFYRARLLVPQVNPNTLARLTPKIVGTIPSDMAIELRAIPVSLDRDNNLTVAMSDPSDRHAVDEIAFFTGTYVVRAVATQMQIAWCLAHYYGHVTALGQRLLHASEVASPIKAAISAASQRLPRAKGLTGKVDAARHRAIAPITGPINIMRPNSGELDLRPLAAKIDPAIDLAITPVDNGPPTPVDNGSGNTPIDLGSVSPAPVMSIPRHAGIPPLTAPRLAQAAGMRQTPTGVPVVPAPRATPHSAPSTSPLPPSSRMPAVVPASGSVQVAAQAGVQVPRAAPDAPTMPPARTESTPPTPLLLHPPHPSHPSGLGQPGRRPSTPAITAPAASADPEVPVQASAQAQAQAQVQPPDQAQPKDPAPAPSNGAPERPRARSVSGEIRVPVRRAASIRPPMPEPDPEDPEDDDDEPVIVIERPPAAANPIHDETTGPRKLPPRRRAVKSDPPELYARAGEVDLKTGDDRPVDDEPRIVIDEDALSPPTQRIDTRRTQIDSAPPGPTAAPETAIEDADTGAVIRNRVVERSEPVLLERPRALPTLFRSTKTGVPTSPLPKPDLSDAGDDAADGANGHAHPSTNSSATDDANDDVDTGEVVLVLDAQKAKPRPIATRPERRTQVGIPPAPVNPRPHRDTETTGVPTMLEHRDFDRTMETVEDPTMIDMRAAPRRSDDTSSDHLAAPPAPVRDDDTNPHIIAPPPKPAPPRSAQIQAAVIIDDEDEDDDDDDDDSDGGDDHDPDLEIDTGELPGARKLGMSTGGLDRAGSERAAEVEPEHLAPRRVDYDPIDDGWGPPGTTIPPPLLGAIPGSEDDEAPSVIPMPSIDSSPLLVGPPSPSALGDSGGLALARALEDATARAIEVIRQLEHAQSRDDVVQIMIAHLIQTHHRAGFFVTRPGASKSSELGLFAMTPKPATMPFATLVLDRPSTLQDVVGTRLPYRGPMHDDASRSFLISVLGACPAEILLVPVAVRERVVGVLFGEHRQRHTFDDQLALAARAAGMALERILKAKRG
jgi:hypothetical protein